jgi:cysteine desulfuration protein SufE
MSQLNARQQEVIDEFSVFDDWMDRYAYLIDLGKELPAIDETFKQENYLIKGCQSRVWLNADYRNGLVYFTADSDAIITKGIVGLLIRVLSGLPAAEIMNADLYFVDKIGLRENLSPTRSNGLNSMIKQMKMYALAYQTKFNT